jgi:hypothetical protein
LAAGNIPVRPNLSPARPRRQGATMLDRLNNFSRMVGLVESVLTAA